MSSPKKPRVAVLYGGRSGEHEISLLSAANVVEHLDRSRFEIIPIGIDRQGKWLLGDTTATAPLLPEVSGRLLFDPEAIGTHEISCIEHSHSQSFDVIFPVMHGSFCEDGAIQGLFELADVPYVGCGVLASAVGMDKDISKRLAKEAGIHTAPYLVIKRTHWDLHPDKYCRLVAEQLVLPVFVKPANTGSSVGIEKVKVVADLRKAIENAFQYDTKIVIEQGIDAIELEVAVLESLSPGEDPIVSTVGEIRPKHEFYSYAAKYLDTHGADLLIPAELPETIQQTAKETAKNIFAALECEGMARVDLFLERNTHRLYFNEINTIPGFTQISMFPKLMAASGISYPELLTHLVMLALNRQERKRRLRRQYITTSPE